MLIMVPVVMVITGITKGDWKEAGECVYPISPDGSSTTDDSKPVVRSLAAFASLGQHGQGVRPATSEMGWARPRKIHGFNRANQLNFRRHHFLPPMVCLRSEFRRAPIAVSVGLVHRGATFANVDCAYDPHPENPVYSERGSCARASSDRCNHGNRTGHSLHSFRSEHRPAASPKGLLSLVGRDIAELLRRHAVRQALVYSAVQNMVIAGFYSRLGSRTS
jgi:hypothetical protein